MPLSFPIRFALGATLAVSLALPVLAQTMDHSGHTMMGDDQTAMTGDKSPATMAYMEANARMHANMGMSYTGDADRDFVAGMIPHHQGAVDMARIVMEHGTDPDVRAFAKGVIDAQEAEIKWMNDWLAAHPD